MSASDCDDLPPAVRDAPRSVQRVYDALGDADDALTRHDIELETRHAPRTVRSALETLRDTGHVEKRCEWPVTPRYALADSS